MEKEKEAYTKTGKTMLTIAWIFALLVLTLFFGNIEQSWENPNQAPQSQSTGDYVEVVLKRNRYGHYVTTGSINGYPVTFMLDTGASHVAVPKAVAKAIGLEFGTPFKTLTANGVGTSYATHIDRLAIGDIVLTDLKGGITENMPGEQILLGMSALKQIEFTQRGHRLILRQYQ